MRSKISFLVDLVGVGTMVMFDMVGETLRAIRSR